MKTCSVFFVFYIFAFCSLSANAEMFNIDFSIPLSGEPNLEPTAFSIPFSFDFITDAPTQVPTVAPSIEPTVIPSAEPSVAPSVEPSVAPTFEPTIAPSFLPTEVRTEEPTVVPTTRAPSFSPTFFPTPVEFISFTSSLLISGIPDLDIDDDEKEAIAGSACEVMNLPRDDCEFVRFQETNNTRRLQVAETPQRDLWSSSLRGWQELQRILQETFSIIAIVRTIVDLNQREDDEVDADDLASTLEDRLVQAVNDGTMTETLQAIAAEFNITDLLNANVTGVAILETVESEDESGGGDGDDGGLSRGEVAALVVCLVLAAGLMVVGMYFLHRYFLKKRLEESKAAERSADNDSFPPSPIFKNVAKGGDDEPVIISGGGGGNIELSREPSRESLFDKDGGSGDDLRPTEKSGALIEAEPVDPEVIPL